MYTTRYTHPLPLSRWQRRWQRRINAATRDLNTEIYHIENHLAAIKAGEQYRGGPLSGHGGCVDRCRKEIDKYQRLLDGRPTFEAEATASAARFEAAMDAEYQREVSGGWADDEFNAQYDDNRERYSAELADFDRD